jgi:N-acetylneuraminic acid mutarotase
MDGVGYSIVQHDYKARLWSYIPETDEWKQLSHYPGKGIRGFLMFAIDGFIYLGGGMHQKDMYDEQVGVTDFWRYNLKTQEWEQLGDLPFTPVSIYSVNSTCVDGHKAYTFFYDRNLWSYDATTDGWHQEEALYQGPYFRYFSPLCMWDGKVCLIGGYDKDDGRYNDIQLYDPATRQWTLKGIFEYFHYMSTHYIPSIHQRDGEIWMGPLQLWGTYDQPAPQFLKIKTR